MLNIVVQCTMIALLVISIVMPCIGIKFLMISIGVHCVAFDKQLCNAMELNG